MKTIINVRMEQFILQSPPPCKGTVVMRTFTGMGRLFLPI